jgi:hypothetical protein
MHDYSTGPSGADELAGQPGRIAANSGKDGVGFGARLRMTQGDKL